MTSYPFYPARNLRYIVYLCSAFASSVSALFGGAGGGVKRLLPQNRFQNQNFAKLIHDCKARSFYFKKMNLSVQFFRPPFFIILNPLLITKVAIKSKEKKQQKTTKKQALNFTKMAL